MQIAKPEALDQNLRTSVNKRQKAMLEDLAEYYGVSQSQVIRSLIEHAHGVMSARREEVTA